MTYPSIYPTGATVYDSSKCYNGYTVFQAKEHGALVIDMNGGEVKLWRGLHGFPNKLLPGGQILGHTGERSTLYGMQDYRDLIQVDWDGNVVWKFNKYEFIDDPGEEPQWMARIHHDYQRQGNPVGYYVPGMEPQIDSGNTMLLGHKNTRCKAISDKNLLDDTVYEVSWDGEILWEWVCSDHFEEFGFREDARNALSRDPNMRPCGGGMGDWMHLNSMSLLGPNKWFDAGDARFHPDNIIVDGRETNIIFIISKATGEIVWKVGPYYDTTPEKDLEWIIGQHHAHMIPKGLPGEGNILVYDNGGWAGYGGCHPSSQAGTKNVLRDYSRVLEFDPVSLKIVWQYTPHEAGLVHPTDSNRLYSPFISAAQRLPNGNTLITEGSGGRLIEVTAAHELVWEYISPYWGRSFNMNMVYRAYRYPYEYIPQVDVPQEVDIKPINVVDFRVEGASPRGARSESLVDGVVPYQTSSALCVLSDTDDGE
ncbi:aryl-sulfate sulfotransferase [Desulfosediminicola flagellatus]|uniref:aryl-sulfate sulfotransferase n=1 Tax=Desulfosediminicola flagellatus TaxID=2569541 RepID=UPI0010ACCDC5|nr:aryl-sulfate sulfotransferase [Desulfosediminicola flagellatus]